MAEEYTLVQQLQRRVENWNPSEPGRWHSDPNVETKRGIFDAQRRLIELHLGGLEITQVSSEVGQFSALQRLYLGDNQLSTLPAEVGQLTSLQELHLMDNPLLTP